MATGSVVLSDANLAAFASPFVVNVSSSLNRNALSVYTFFFFHTTARSEMPACNDGSVVVQNKSSNILHY